MKLAMWGMAIVVVSPFLHSLWLCAIGMAVMVIGVLFSYQRPQDDPVYRKLVEEGVIEDDDVSWRDAYRHRSDGELG